MCQQQHECIYCHQRDASLFRGVEHLIPQSFGTFGSDTPTLDCVCDECNRYFGRELDSLLARETHEGISRYVRGIRSSEARPQKRLTITLAEGPDTGSLAGARVAVDGTTGKLMPLAGQFVIYNFRTGKTETYFENQIPTLVLPEDAYGKPGTGGKKGTWKCKVLAPSKEGHDIIVEALQRAGINFQPGAPLQPPAFESVTPLEPLTFPVVVEVEIDDQHKRAIAKILMNFVAYYLGHDEVLRPRWNFLREFIRNGVGKIRTRVTDQPFWTGQETDHLRFVDDSINVRVENMNGHIVGAIQFYNQITYEMVLVENDLLPDEMQTGYRFTRGEAPIPAEKRAR